MAEELLDAQSHVVRVEKLAGIGRLAAGVAHEIRNPLGALGTYVEVLRRRGSDPDITGEMHVAIGRVDRIVQGLLDYARPERRVAGAEVRGPAQTDLNDAVATAVDFLDASGLAQRPESGARAAPRARPACGANGTGWSRWSSICL